MRTQHGWERIATAFLEDGRYLAAGTDHFSTGTYMLSDGTLVAELQIEQHGKVRALFGVKKKHLSTRFEAKIKHKEKNDKIVGRMHTAAAKKSAVKMRLTQLGGTA